MSIRARKRRARTRVANQQPRSSVARLAGWLSFLLVVVSTGYVVQQRIAARPPSPRALGVPPLGGRGESHDRGPTVGLGDTVGLGAAGTPSGEAATAPTAVEAAEAVVIDTIPESNAAGGPAHDDRQAEWTTATAEVSFAALEQTSAADLAPLQLKGMVSDDYREFFDAFRLKRTVGSPAAFASVADEGVTDRDCVLASASYVEADVEDRLAELASSPEPPAPVFWSQETYREVLIELAQAAERVRDQCSPETMEVYSAAWDEEARRWDSWVREYELAGGTPIDPA